MGVADIRRAGMPVRNLRNANANANANANTNTDANTTACS